MPIASAFLSAVAARFGCFGVTSSLLYSEFLTGQSRFYAPWMMKGISVNSSGNLLFRGGF